jgi:hypothetical protein
MIEHQLALKKGQRVGVDPSVIAPMPVTETAAMFFRFVRNAIFLQPTSENLIALHMV